MFLKELLFLFVGVFLWAFVCLALYVSSLLVWVFWLGLHKGIKD